MWFSKRRQVLRFELICKYIFAVNQRGSISISDVGCGYGAFLDYLLDKKMGQDWRYFGFDLSSEVIEYCKKKYTDMAVFYNIPTPIQKTDFIIMSGTFNYFPSGDYNLWRLYFQKSLKVLWNKVNCAMIFNLQVSDHVGIKDSGIVYTSKEEVEVFCNHNLGNTELLHHRLIPNDMTFVVKK